MTTHTQLHNDTSLIINEEISGLISGEVRFEDLSSDFLFDAAISDDLDLWDEDYYYTDPVIIEIDNNDLPDMDTEDLNPYFS